ncbi:YybH family protein [Amycolatopsis roodepoortensis]|uniref:Ketosteroid isomerase-like protein n=1 Tax=Amycolatopsis roodepoortensis TaxID=700274 RepID=A0ABR9L662_9PSEU|nr:nuclear transport factor 2 family protein [Amycolatopsis roodepoortensis]MBE1576095.1 ketosteroid isomerase-like protein [Amycolatopsis roodepoortensis]
MTHSPSVPLTADAAEHPFVFQAAFNTGSAEILDTVYEPDAVFVRRDGVRVSGAGRRAANSGILALGQPIEVTPRQVHVSGDLALLIVDWVIEGHLSATATDVARRGEDGLWRYVIDNPFGLGAP